MPIFDYKCSVCGQMEEHMVKQMDVDKIFYCSNCNGQMDKQISAVKDSAIKITGMQRFTNNGKTRHNGDY